MYTNEKPYALPAYAKTPLLSRARWITAAVMTGSALCGGLLGLFEQQAGDAAPEQARAPDAPASTVPASRGNPS